MVCPWFQLGARLTSSRLHQAPSNSSSSQSKQLPHQQTTFIKIKINSKRKNILLKNVLRKENYCPCSVTTRTSASPSQQVTAEQLLHEGATCMHLWNGMQHKIILLQSWKTCPRDSQTCLVMELCLLNKFYSELQYIKRKCDQPVRSEIEHQSLQYTQRKHTTYHTFILGFRSWRFEHINDLFKFKRSDLDRTQIKSLHLLNPFGSFLCWLNCLQPGCLHSGPLAHHTGPVPPSRVLLAQPHASTPHLVTVPFRPEQCFSNCSGHQCFRGFMLQVNFNFKTCIFSL